VNYGFIIDNRKCIGCHACTVACKAEHETPLGVNRTWVKYIEKGAFPDTRRFFSVLRCNHCEDAPCTTICPVSALYTREDGIVDFDSERCIGCKACIQGCPYDAIHIDPNTNTAAKCNYCAHRVEVGLEPPCVVVCPERAIIPGDLEDPDSEIARLLRRTPVQVRKPEKGTVPNVFYIDADTASLTPSAAPPREAYTWSQGREPGVTPRAPARAEDGVAGSLSDEIWDRVRAVMGERADRVGRVYDSGQTHQDSWGWKISAYLWTKSIACGTMMLAPFLWGLAGTADYGNVRLSGVVLSLLFLGATMALLVADLKRPDRFLWVMTRPQWSSWLTRGSYILFVFGLLASGMLAARLVGLAWLWSLLAIPTVLAAAGGAVYTAFLFWQSKGRDLWQSPLLPLHLLLQALLAGMAALQLVRAAAVGPIPALTIAGLGAATWFKGLLILNGVAVILEVSAIHQTADASAAARWMSTGERGRLLRWGVLLAGHVIPLALVFLGLPGFLTLAGLLALGGLLAYEHLYVRAGQMVPLS
jgi:Fe-S-cluster-containing dehydrogenase component/formate-dependent nitrite reductase membrane component NrfD